MKTAYELATHLLDRHLYEQATLDEGSESEMKIIHECREIISKNFNEKNDAKNKVYLAGGMLTKAEQMLRTLERDDIKSIGLDLYVPQDNKDINDKSKVSNDGLAERIVKQDTDAIFDTNITVIEVMPHYIGTIIELGQHKGMIDVSKKVLELINSNSPEQALNEIKALTTRISNKVILPHCEDIRRFPHAGIDESEDRRSFSHNAYLYGTVLDLTNGYGFYEWEDILKKLSIINENKGLNNEPSLI